MDETSAINPDRTAIEPREVGTSVARGYACDLETLIADHKQPVARLAQRLLGSAEGVEDVVQEVFLAAFENLGRFRGDCRVSTWLATVTLNKCRSLIRRRTIRRRLFPWNFQPSLESEPERANRAENTHEVTEEVRRAVHRLPRKYREPVVLRYFESMTLDDIGSILGLAKNTVEVRLSRARQKLREILADRLME